MELIGRAEKLSLILVLAKAYGLRSCFCFTSVDITENARILLLFTLLARFAQTPLFFYFFKQNPILKVPYTVPWSDNYRQKLTSFEILRRVNRTSLRYRGDIAVTV